MAASKVLNFDTRLDQMFPVLDAADIVRVRRFGTLRRYGAGEALARVGQVGDGLAVILSGTIEISRRDKSGVPQRIHDFGPGSFLGEMAQLAGRPSLYDADTTEPVDALILAPERMRALLIAEADLGERMMRALILRRTKLYLTGVGGPVIIGHAENGDVLRLEGFLARNGHPHETLNPDTDADAHALIERFHLDPGHLPIVLCPNGQLLRNPTEHELARCLGLVGPIDPYRVFDVAIVGAGPAGLATAVYAASEGLSVLMLDSRSFGGQAGASARIENYLGFPTGITGMALMARAYHQATKFGVETAIPNEVTGFDAVQDAKSGHFVLKLASDERVSARSVVVASGVNYRRLGVEHLDAYEGSSVHYWASPLEGKLCSGQDVVLVGAGNAAGQGVVYLAQNASKVWVLVRGNDLESTMSRYLVDRIQGLSNVEVLTHTEISALEGADGALSAVRWRQAGGAGELRRAIRHLFLFIGADPNTAWLAGSGVALDAKGFVLTGAQAGDNRRSLETNRPGVFAIGDIRSGSIKRVAAAVGEGAQVVAALHAFLGTRIERPPPLADHREAVVAGQRLA
jgi:thioredoxin reductase (NADPH)